MWVQLRNLHRVSNSAISANTTSRPAAISPRCTERIQERSSTQPPPWTGCRERAVVVCRPVESWARMAPVSWAVSGPVTASVFTYEVANRIVAACAMCRQ